MEESEVSNILIGPEGICGCSSFSSEEQGPDYFSCCQVVDLDQIYELEPTYSTDNPCAQTRFDVITEGECNSTPTSPPHGEILPYRRACARLVVWGGAKIDGEITYSTRKVLYSRQREDLPTEDCENPIYCPAENEIYTCCLEAAKANANLSQVGGPYDGCEEGENFENDCQFNCDGATPQFYKYGMSNCSFDGKVLAGYAEAPNDWWFLDTPEFEGVEDSIIQNNPYGPIKQTIYAHFQLEWKPILCDTFGGIPESPCNGAGRLNHRNGRCFGDHKIQGLSIKEEREKAVKITALIGFSIGSCGWDPEKACTVLQQ